MKISYSILLILCSTVYSQSISGYLKDVDGSKLPSGNVYILGTNRGTATNTDGYYSIFLSPGTHKIVFSYLGYQNDTLVVTINSNNNIVKNVILQPSSIQLDFVSVYAEKYNSAEMIILNAIERKNEYLSKIKNYEYDAYNKTVFRIPKDSIHNIGGITEVQSKGFFEFPDKFQEIVVAKKQTANFSDLFNIFTTGRIISVLNDVIHIDELAVISPLSTNALEYYDFKMIDTTYFNSKRVYHISIKPKKENIPLFEGDIKIVDKIFTVIEIHLWGVERIKATIKSDVEIYQSFREFENYFWLPVQANLFYRLDMGLPGIKKLHIKQYGQLTNYVLNDPNFKHKFSSIIVKQADNNLTENDSVWNSQNALPLTQDEKNAYRSLDSLMKTKNLIIKTLLKLPAYYISLKQLPVTEFSDFYRFNRVEGNYLGVGFDSKQLLDKMNFNLILGHGFGNKKTIYSFDSRFQIGSSFFSLFAGYKNVTQFLDPYYQYNKLDLTFQGLVLRNDYADYYYSKLGYVGLDLQLSQNLNGNISYSKHKDSNARLSDSYSIFGKKNLRNDVLIKEGDFNEIAISLDFDNRKYRDFGWGDILDNSRDFLRLRLNANWAPKNWNNDISFSQLNFVFNIYKRIPPYFNVNFSLLSGYLDNISIIQRRFHLPGSYGSYTNPRMFRTLRNDIYVGKYYLCFFIENNFKNTIFNLLSIPFFKQSKYDLYIFGNLGWMNNVKWENNQNVETIRNIPYSEIGFGIGNILLYLRMDFAWKISHRGYNNFNFKITSNLNY